MSTTPLNPSTQPYDATWGTPIDILNIAARRLNISSFAIDLATSTTHISRLKIEETYTIERPPFGAAALSKPRVGVWCNPPGPYKSTHDFWRLFTVVAHVGAFLFFSVDHMRGLNLWRKHLAIEVIVWPRRIKYIRQGKSVGSPTTSALVLVDGRDPSRHGIVSWIDASDLHLYRP